MDKNAENISIVIPTHNRSKYVFSLLSSLRIACDKYSRASEILVIDDSDENERILIKKYCSNLGAEYIEGAKNVRQKRNRGIELANYPIILFVDSDCEVTSDLLEQHRICYCGGDKIGAVVGVTEFIGNNSFMWEVITRTQYLNAFSFAKRMDYAPWATCSNTSFRKEILLQMDGFDTKFPFKLGGDDTDLGLRLNKAGYRMKCNQNAVVSHSRETWSKFSAIIKRAFRWGRMDVHLYYRKHKDFLALSMPKYGTVFIGFFLAGVVKSLINHSGIYLLLPLSWGLMALFLQSVETVIVKKDSPFKIRYELIADILGLAFEFGTLYEGIKSREYSVFYKTVKRGPLLPMFQFYEGVLQQWSIWIAVLLTIIML